MLAIELVIKKKREKGMVIKKKHIGMDKLQNKEYIISWLTSPSWKDSDSGKPNKYS